MTYVNIGVGLPIQVSPARQAAEKGRVTQVSQDWDDNDGDFEACDLDENTPNVSRTFDLCDDLTHKLLLCHLRPTSGPTSSSLVLKMLTKVSADHAGG